VFPCRLFRRKSLKRFGELGRNRTFKIRLTFECEIDQLDKASIHGGLMNLKRIIAPLTVLLMASIAAIVLMPSRTAVGIPSQQRSAARDRQTLID
jgi:hypothetical protein